MKTPTDDTRLLASLGDVRELEDFLHTLLVDLSARRPKRGQDLLPYARQLGLTVPAALKGLDITWESGARLNDDDLGKADGMSIVRPGNPNALGLTIGCVRIGRRVKVCLECGWLYCKIVIKGTF